MDLVNIVYRYINRFINSEELVELLTNIDKTKFSEEENEKIGQLLEAVKEIIKTVPIEVDKVEINKINSINRMLDNFEKMLANEDNNEEVKEFAQKKHDSLMKDKEKQRDSGPRYHKLFDTLVNNSVYSDHCKSMSDLEMLEFIAQYISAPIVPNIDQETFNDLVKAGIQEDKREALWRLAFNYNRHDMDFTLIEDYFIEKRDDYYLLELVSAVEEDLNMDKLVEKVAKTKDKEFMGGCYSRAKSLGIFTEEQLEEIKEKYNK